MSLWSALCSMARSLVLSTSAGRGATLEAAAVNPLRFALLATPLVGATFLSKFAFPPFGALGIGVSLFLVLAAVTIGSIADCVRIDPRRLTLFALMTGCLGLMQ